MRKINAPPCAVTKNVITEPFVGNQLQTHHSRCRPGLSPSQSGRDRRKLWLKPTPTCSPPSKRWATFPRWFRLPFPWVSLLSSSRGRPSDASSSARDDGRRERLRHPKLHHRGQGKELQQHANRVPRRRGQFPGVDTTMQDLFANRRSMRFNWVSKDARSSLIFMSDAPSRLRSPEFTRFISLIRWVRSLGLDGAPYAHQPLFQQRCTPFRDTQLA